MFEAFVNIGSVPDSKMVDDMHACMPHDAATQYLIQHAAAIDHRRCIACASRLHKQRRSLESAIFIDIIFSLCKLAGYFCHAIL